MRTNGLGLALTADARRGAARPSTERPSPLMSGTGAVRHKDGKTPIGPGDAFLFKPNEPHQLINDGAQEMETSPWMLLVPAALLVLVLGAFSVLGDALRARVRLRDD